MGNGGLERKGRAKNGADGAYEAPGKQEMTYLVRACEQVLNWLRLGGVTIAGATYGSDHVVLSSEGREELYRYVFERYYKLAGKAMPFTVDIVAKTYSGCRKGNYENLRDGKAITKGCRALPLFGELEDDVVATVYAYWGSNQKAGRRLIKIGYTEQELTKYLRTLERAYDPRLMAQRCGGRPEEQEIHRAWSRFRAEGREWYWATEAMFDSFRRDWKTTEEFEVLVEEALEVSPF